MDLTGFGTIASSVSGLAKSIVNAIAPDKTEVEKDSAAFKIQQLIADSDAFKEQAAIIKAEAQSGNWLTSSWRPITMLTFLALIVSWWFGFTPARATEALMLELFAIIKLGLGGYTVGRSAEKIATTVAPLFKK